MIEPPKILSIQDRYANTLISFWGPTIEYKAVHKQLTSI